jgi:capsular polysaccharide biosynthesis protein/Mrp family chromosome partitioning ATPase
VSTQVPADELPPIVGFAIRRRWLLIVTVTLVVTALAALFSLTRASRYESTVEVFVRPITGNAFSPQENASSQQLTIALETEASLVSSPGVTSLVSAQLHQDIPPGTDLVSASVLLNSQIIDISFTASTPAEAQAGAQAFGNSFLAFRSTQATDDRQSQLATLTAQSKQAQAQLDAAAADADSGNGSAGTSARISLYTAKVTALEASIGDVRALSTQPGSIVVPASLPSTPQGLPPLLLIIAGALVGLAIGVAGAIWRTRKDDRVHPDSEVTVGHVPIWAAVPGGTPMLTDTDGGAESRPREQYRRLRTALLATRPGPATICVSGVDATVPPSEVALNLASALVKAGYVAALVDATLDDTGVAELLGLPRRPGVSDVVLGTHETDAVATDAAGLRVVTRGLNPSAARDSYAGERFGQMLKNLGLAADYVVVAAPPLSDAGGMTIAAALDCTLLVFGQKRSTHHEIRELVERSQGLGITVAGLVALDSR